jgi:polysaccharide biosynthesis transport protein
MTHPPKGFVEMPAYTRERAPAASEYARMVWDRRWLILALTVTGALLAIFTRPTAAPATYQSTVPIEIRSLTLDNPGQVSSTLFRVPAAEVEAARSVEVASTTAQQLGMSDGGTDLLSRLSVEPVEDSPVIYLTLSGEGPETVDQLQTYAENYVDYRRTQDQTKVDETLASIDERIASVRDRLEEYSRRLERERKHGEASPLTSAQFEATSDLYRQHVTLREQIVLDSSLENSRFQLLSAPLSQRLDPIPTGTLRLILFPLAGLVIGVAVALTLGVLRPKIYGRRQIEDLDVPLLATIPRAGKDRRVRRDPLLVQRASGWGNEAIGKLRTELHVEPDRGASEGAQVVGVGSASAGEGKTTIATNLAASCAASGTRTALFRADAADVRASGGRRRRTVALGGSAAATSAMRTRTDSAGFDEVFMAPRDGGARQHLISQAIERLRRDYDVVVIDTPPLLHTADAIVLATGSDTFVLAVRQGVTLEDEASSALDLLRRHEVTVVGAVLNGVVVSRLTGYGRVQRYSSAKRPAVPVSIDVHPYGGNGRGADQGVETRGSSPRDPSRPPTS